MHLFLASVVVLVIGGLACLLSGRRFIASNIGALTCVGASALALAASARALGGKSDEELLWHWSIPLGSFHLGVDGLSAWFAGVIALVCGWAAVYGVQYLRPYQGRKNLGAAWFFYCLLMASMLLVVLARDGLLFLIAWEIMSLASFFLVMFDAEQPGTVRAGWTYLVATHLGTAFLLAMFVVLSQQWAGLDFALLKAGSPGMAGVCFLLALAGFGTKAGFVPLHVWLPEAHPAAPSHVSAVMSGVMIKTGIYGLLRTVTFLGPPPAWFGWTLVAIGAVSGVLGVLLALAQHDLKRLLAYHSVENIGIIALGLGLGLVGLSTGNHTMAAFGMLGGLLHVLNHAIFKSLLFLGAGSVLHATGSRNIEQMGGLMKRMGGTGAAFLVGSAAIAGLPPLNGFISEFLIYVGAFGTLAAAPTAKSAVLPALAAILALSMIGGLAAACFAKAFGVVFLGEPRSDAARGAHEAPLGMRLPMFALAGLCALIGLAGPLAVKAAIPAVSTLLPQLDVTELSRAPLGMLWNVSLGAAAFILLAAGLFLLRRVLLCRRSVTESGTWDCGYAAPTARMQYSASSFAAPILGMFRLILRPHEDVRAPKGLFPAEASLHTRQDDMFMRALYEPLFGAAAWLAGRLRCLQGGPNQLYVLYVALAILALLIWKLGWPR